MQQIEELESAELQLPDNFQLSPEMKRCIDLLNAGKNVFLTGNAGTGKSTLLAYLKQNIFEGNIGLCAPTGVSALLIGGVTIHSLFGFHHGTTLEEVKGPKYNPKNRYILQALKFLVIDEISMVRADMMDCIDQSLRRYGPKKGKPFGGVQVLVIGDLCQLPPIAKTDEEQQYLQDNYRSYFFLDSKALEDSPFDIVHLTKVHRQNDLDFVKSLDALRLGEMTREDYFFFDGLVDMDFKIPKEDFFITLSPKKNVVSQINAEALESLPGDALVKWAVISGDFKSSAYPTERKLEMKVGAQIMMVANDSGERWQDGEIQEKRRWVNGSLGVIEMISLSGNKPFVMVKILESGRTHKVYMKKFVGMAVQLEDGKLKYVEGPCFIQFPFMLAWAVTIHKAQGKTFERVVIDLTEKAFDYGQLYVALVVARLLREQFCDNE